MKKIAVAALVILLSLSSCSTYYYSILETPNKNMECIENGDFLYQNDSLWIAYNFNGENAPVKVTVFNKLDVPITIDWKKSALIIDNVAESYADTDTEFYGAGVEVEHKTDRHHSVSYGEFSGVIERSADISHIFPQTMVSKKFMNIYTEYNNIKNSEYSDVQIADKRKKSHTVKKINFAANTTPLAFKSYLTIYVDPQKPVGYMNDFYLAGILKTNSLSPNNLPPNMIDQGNIFFREKTNNTGWYVAGTTAVVAIVAIPLIFVDMSTDIEHPSGW